VLAALLVAAFAGAVLAPTAYGSHTGRQPNVVVIVTDDQPVGSMDVMPATRYRFGTLGTTFSEAYATTPLCCPSRGSIFSGRFAHNHHVQTNSNPESLEQDWTLQRYLHDAGYQTAIFGRYLNLWNIWLPPAHFDRYGIVGAWDLGYYPYINEDGTIRHLADTGYYSTHYIRDRAIDFVRRAESDDRRPWLMFLGLNAPHRPFELEPKYVNAPVPAYETTAAFMEADMSDKPTWLLSTAIASGALAQNERAGQLRTLMSVDDMVERVFRELRVRGEEEDTLAFFVSDNGYMWGQHRQTRKTKPYTESIKVPLLMRWPSHRQRVKRGATDDRLATNTDIAPTILDATGVDPPAGAPAMDGVSLLGPQRRQRLLLEYYRDGILFPDPIPAWASTRTASYQYVEWYEQDGVTPKRWGDGTPVREYYDLTADPIQNVNLLHDGNPTNDPNVAPLSVQLGRDRLCEGSSCHPGAQEPPIVDRQPPRPLLIFLNPIAVGTVVRSSVNLSGFATDNIGVAGVRFEVDGVPVTPEETQPQYNGSWDTTLFSDGRHNVTAVARDAAGNTARSAAVNVTVDNTSPSGVDVQTCVPPTGCSTQTGSIENGDSLTYYFSEPMDPDSLLAGWDGTPSTVLARIDGDVPLFGYVDVLTVPTVPALGTVNLKIQAAIDFYETANFASSTIELSADRKSLTLELAGGPPPTLPPNVNTISLTWKPGEGVRTATGTPVCRCLVPEGEPLDVDF
jgi:arylsulfatase A-like enzyme